MQINIFKTTSNSFFELQLHVKEKKKRICHFGNTDLLQECFHIINMMVTIIFLFLNLHLLCLLNKPPLESSKGGLDIKT